MSSGKYRTGLVGFTLVFLIVELPFLRQILLLTTAGMLGGILLVTPVERLLVTGSSP
jgi:hypothetical protein